MPGAAMSSFPTMVTWAEGLFGDATVTTHPRSIATSKPSRSTKKSRVSAGFSDLMFGTALLIFTVRVLSDDRPTRQPDAAGVSTHQPQPRAEGLISCQKNQPVLLTEADSRAFWATR